MAQQIKPPPQESHMGISSTTGCSASSPAPFNVPGKSGKYGPSSWDPAPTGEKQKKFLNPSFNLAHQIVWPSERVNQNMEDLFLSLTLIFTLQHELFFFLSVERVWEKLKVDLLQRATLVLCRQWKDQRHWFQTLLWQRQRCGEVGLAHDS